MSEERIAYLFHRCFNGTPTLEERRELLELAADPAWEAVFRKYMEQEWDGLQPREVFTAFEQDMMVDSILAGEPDEVPGIMLATETDEASGAILAAKPDDAPGAISPVTRRFPLLRRYWWAAAAVMLLLATAAYFRFQHRRPEMAVTPVIDAAPGTSKAFLTLADGSTLALDSAGNQVFRQGATTIQQQGGQLLYKVQAHSSAPGYNTLYTPRGGQFQVRLPDGTSVWLNAASSLRYPTAFTGSERKVEITGEAYFEVAKDEKMPFRVKINEQVEIEVLGTHFNVNAYTDEPFGAISLLEGSVKVSGFRNSYLLKPGQQAQLTAQSISIREEMDAEEVLAWKNGFFQFSNTDLAQVLRQLQRWYNIQVNYDKLPAKHFYGTISRSSSLEQVLRMLQVTGGVQFSKEGGKLIVTEKR